MRAVPAILLFSVLTGLPAAAASPQAGQNAAADMKAVAGYGKLPISFEANQGQAAQPVRFLAHGQGYGIYLDGQEAVLALHSSKPDNSVELEPQGKAHPPAEYETSVVHMQLRGANTDAQAAGVDLLLGTANYFIGKDPSQWHTGIPTYSKAKFAGVYPGIDLIYYGNQGHLEYDFVVAPGADPKAILLHFEGSKTLRVNASGDLCVATDNGDAVFHKPNVYQGDPQHAQKVAGRFALQHDGNVTFALGRYDRSQALVIDPTLDYSTYIGGSGNDSVNGIGVDGEGNAYITGTTTSSDFPGTSSGYQSTNKSQSGGTTAFIAKLNNYGSELLYATYLGGSGSDFASAIAISSAGNAFVTGTSYSSDFPVTAGAFQSANNDVVGGNAFVAEIDPTGKNLIYATYVGGSGNIQTISTFTGDSARAIAIDQNGDAYITGAANSDDFPVTSGAFQSTNNIPTNIGGPNAFITKLNPTGSGLIYSTYLGGSGSQQNGDAANGIAVDNDGNAYVAGSAYSVDFPITPDVYQNFNYNTTFLGGGPMGPAIFVTKLDPSGSALVYSTYVTGILYYPGMGSDSQISDFGNAITIDKDGDAYVAGATQSFDFPTTPGAFIGGVTGGFVNCFGANGYVFKLSPDATKLLTSTCLTNPVNALAIDSAGNAYVAGSSTVGQFEPLPVLQSLNYYQKAQKESPTAYLFKVNAQGTTLLFSTYLGGSGSSDSGNAIAVDADGNAYLGGATGATNFPVTPIAFQSSIIKGATNGFVAKFGLGSYTQTHNTVLTVTPSVNPIVFGEPVTFTAKVTNTSDSAVPVGNVQFILENDPSYLNITTLALVNGSANLPYATNLFVGQYQYPVVYKGIPPFTSSSTTLNVTLLPPPPAFSPAPGKYTGSVTVSLANNVYYYKNNPVYLYYTLDGSTPTPASPLYTGPITLPAGYTVIRAITNISGYNSPVSLGAYSVIPQTPAPVISPGSQTVPAGQLVTITDAVAGATIRYTTDGSTPTLSSTFYNQPIVVNQSETIRAIALGTGKEPSEVTTTTFTVQ